MMPDNDFTKEEKTVFGCILSLIVVIICVILVVIGTGLYLAVHNWG